MGCRNSRLKKLAVPYYPKESDIDVGEWFLFTAEEKSIATYAGISLFDVYELDLIEYLMLRKDARIHNLMQTEDGREYLKNAWRIMQTAPERGRLREKFGNKQESE